VNRTDSEINIHIRFELPSEGSSFELLTQIQVNKTHKACPAEHYIDHIKLCEKHFSNEIRIFAGGKKVA